MEDERAFLAHLPHLPDLQCVWLLLSMCAAPRCNHILRVVPPSLSRRYAEEHDDAIWHTGAQLLSSTAASLDRTYPYARQIAGLPTHLGGLGLLPATRTAAAAYWAGWADALAVLQQRRPHETNEIVATLNAEVRWRAHCLDELLDAAHLLTSEGFTQRPTWTELAAGRRPPPQGRSGQEASREPGEWAHGWQFYASRTRSTYRRETHIMPQLSETHQALLRSQSGPNAGAWLGAVPAGPGLELKPLHMLTALRRRLRLPLGCRSRWCGGPRSRGCGREVDIYGDHAAACTRAGVIQRRAKPVEAAWCRVTREGLAGQGQVVAQQWLANTTAAGPDPSDRRRLDMVIYGLSPLGRVLCCDATLVSPVHRNGRAQRHTARRDGEALRRAEERKKRRYQEVLDSPGAELVVLAAEVGGRWIDDCSWLAKQFLKVRVAQAPRLLRTSAALAWKRRWWSLLSVAVQSAFAASLIEPTGRQLAFVGGTDAPPLAEVLRHVD